MNRPHPTAPSRGWRMLILGAALAAAWAAFATLSPAAGLQDDRLPTADPVAWVPAARAAALDVRVAADSKAEPGESAPSEAEPPADRAKKPRGRVGVTVDGEKDRVVVRGFGHDEEFDSFAEFVERAPWIAGIVFVTTFLVFLVPLLIIALLIWYKVRKTRMQNETMLKLAEKGVIAPGEALTALANGRQAEALAATPATAPLYEQAKQIRKRAAWSDLRKGVILLAIGVALSAFSMFDDGTPNVIGLVLLFLGLGYLVLWYLEDRQAAPREGGTPPAGGA